MADDPSSRTEKGVESRSAGNRLRAGEEEVVRLGSDETSDIASTGKRLGGDIGGFRASFCLALADPLVVPAFVYGSVSASKGVVFAPALITSVVGDCALRCVGLFTSLTVGVAVASAGADVIGEVRCCGVRSLSELMGGVAGAAVGNGVPSGGVGELLRTGFVRLIIVTEVTPAGVGEIVRRCRSPLAKLLIDNIL